MTHTSHPRNPPDSVAGSGSPEALGIDAQLVSDAQLRARLSFLLTAAIQRQVWLFFLDSEYRLIEPIMPMNDHPNDPHELHDTDDLGRLTFPQVFFARAQQIAAWVGAASFVIVWERPGRAQPTEDDVRWAQAFMRCAAEAGAGDGASLRRLMLLHDKGLRVLDQKDLH